MKGKKLGIFALVCSLFATVGAAFACGDGKENSLESSTATSVDSMVDGASESEETPPEEATLRDLCNAVQNGGTALLNGKSYEVSAEDVFLHTGTVEGVDGKNAERLSVFYLENKKNITIDGGGATVTVTADAGVGYFVDCANITLKNLTVEYVSTDFSEESLGFFFESCQNVKMENVTVDQAPVRALYLQETSNFAAAEFSYTAKEDGGKGNTPFISVLRCMGKIDFADGDFSHGGRLLQSVGGKWRETDISFTSCAAKDFTEGVNLTADTSFAMVGNSLADVDGVVLVGDESLKTPISQRSAEILFQGNTLSDCGGIISLRGGRTDGDYAVQRVQVIENTFKNLREDGYTVQLGEVSRMTYYNNQSDKTINYEDGEAGRVVNDTAQPNVAISLGDSITYGVYTPETGGAPVPIAERSWSIRIAEDIGATKRENYSISGTCFVPMEGTPVPDLALTKRVHEAKGGDNVFIAMGTNDFGCSVPIGEKTDSADTTFYGAVDICFKAIRQNNAWAKVYVVLPIPRSDMQVNSLGKTLDDYRNALRAKAEEFGFSVIDGSTYGVDPTDELQRKAYMFDGVHPMPDGHIYFAQMVRDGMAGKTTPSLAFKEIVKELSVGGTYAVEITHGKNASELTWESLNEDVATVENGVITVRAQGRATVVATDGEGNQAVFVCYAQTQEIPLNDTLYLALSQTLGDESTSILYTQAGGPYRCNYIYVPDEEKRGDCNAIQFTLTVKKGGGYLFLMEGTNTNISTAWGNDGGYSVATVIGKDYHGSFGYTNSVGHWPAANKSVLKIVDVATGEDLSEKSIAWTEGKSYEITYRLPKERALSFMYASSIYDVNGGAMCWGQWNKQGYCYDVPESLRFSNFKAVNMEGRAMIARQETFNLNGYTATVLIPENFNGKWLWKTEFFYAFDKVEQALYNDGYARVYYAISDKYGSPDAVRLMYEFYKEMIKRYEVDKKAYLLGFSRGGLYAFNFALAHPECVEKVHLDAPVLDLRSWPRTEAEYNELYLHEQVMQEYGFESEEEFLNYDAYPVGKLKEYFALNIPTLLVAGDSDQTVAFEENAGVMLDYCKANNIPLTYYIKVNMDHHPHSFGTNEGIDMYGNPYPKTCNVYSSEYVGTDKNNTKEVANEVDVITWFFK